VCTINIIVKFSVQANNDLNPDDNIRISFIKFYYFNRTISNFCSVFV